MGPPDPPSEDPPVPPSAPAGADGRRLRALMAASHDVVGVLGPDGRVVYLSEAAARLTGYPPGGLVGGDPFRSVHPDDAPAARAVLAAAAAAPGAPATAEVRFRRADGRWVWFEVVATDRRDDPAVGGVVLNARDVTERKRREAHDREAAKLDAVSRLAGGIAHDFNNLLTVITGFTEVLTGGLVPGSAEADAAGRVAAAADRAAALTRQLLAFGRRHPAHPVPLDVAAVLRGLEGEFGRLAGPAVRVHLRPAVGLPVVRADQGQFERVVTNLAANAAEAMPAGGDLTISADAADGGVAGDDVPPGRYVVVAVADTGAGIPDAARPHLFEPYFTTKDVGNGPGLGLATAHGIVAQAGGHVRYETAAGRGTTFRVYWPVAGG